MQIDLSKGRTHIRTVTMDLGRNNADYVPISLDIVVTREQAFELLAMVNKLLEDRTNDMKVSITC
jgi:hypothetical protein